MGKHAKGTPPIVEPSYFAQLEPIEHREYRDYLFSQKIVALERTIKPGLQQ
jgi:hypothetical protein